MAGLAPLCKYCANVPLRDPRSGNGRFQYWPLGSARDVKNRDCPLCRVLVTVYETTRQTGAWDDTQPLSRTSSHVMFYWEDNLGPGGRAAFAMYPGGGNISICLAQPTSQRLGPAPRPDPDDEFFLPTVSAEFDVGRLRSWITACTEIHTSGDCSVQPGSFSEFFPELDVLRFIDVESSAIVELREIPRYITLSYVWGETSNVRLTTISHTAFLMPGSMEKAGILIPRTIRDAMDLTRRLGVQYLWVDSLCLIQNDPADVSRGVGVMDEIYERSWLTIIAASGHNANAGLPGIAEGSRSATTAIPITDDLSVGLYISLDWLLQCSFYETRAWT